MIDRWSLPDITECTKEPEPIESLEHLKHIHFSDLDLFKESFAQGNQKSWCYYFPFLLFFSMSQRRKIIFHQDSGSLCVFLFKYATEEDQTPQLDIYFPPAPFSKKALQNSLELANDFNGNRSARIIWIDEKDSQLIKKAIPHGLNISHLEKEYLYDPQLYRELSGSKFRNLRQNLNRINKNYKPEVYSYDVEYADDCLRLLKKMDSESGRKT